MRSPLPTALRVVRGLRRRLLPPVVSVVVPFYNVQEYFGDCVSSLLRQSLGAIEVILVDDGSTDGSHAIAQAFAAADRRVRLVTQRNSGPGAARNTGVARARGTYLSFADSDDRLPPDALKRLVDAARRDGSDIAVGAIRRFNSTRTWVPRWVKGVHSVTQRGIALTDFPEVLRNNYPVGKVFRRTFWESQQLPFREGAIYEDQPLIAQMFNRAARITVLTDIVYDYRAREDRSSVSQRPEDLSDLSDRALAWRLSLEALRAEAPGAVVEGWYDTVYNTHLHWYLNNESVADPDYWRILRDTFDLLAATEPVGVMERLSPEKRVAISLLRADRQDELVAFRNAGGYEGEDFPTTSTAHGLVHDLPVPADVLSVLPPETLLSRPSQLELRQEVTGGRWLEATDGLALELTGYARIVHLDPGEPADIRLSATHSQTGVTIDVETSSADAESGASAYRAVVPIEHLRHIAQTGSWELAIHVQSGDVGVSEPLRSLSARAGFIDASAHVLGRQHVVRLESNPNRHVPLRLVIAEPRVMADSVELSGRTLRVAFRAGAGTRPAHLTLRAPGRPRVSTRLVRAEDSWQGHATPPIASPTEDHSRVAWTVRVEDRIGRALPLTWTDSTGRHVDVGEGALLATGGTGGDLLLEEFPRGYILLTALAADEGGRLRATGRVSGASGLVDLRLEAEGVGDHIISETTHHGNDILTGFLAVSSGTTEGVTVTVTGVAHGADGRRLTLPVVVSHSVLTSLPMRVSHSPLVAERGKERTLRLRLIPAPEGTPA